MKFVHLHVHSHYSVLDGLGKPSDIVKRAVEIGSPAIAITDHGSISSLPEFYRECKKNELNPIIGVEFYVVHNAEGSKDEKRYHLTVWAKSWSGVQSIMSKLTVANEQFYRRPRITFQQALSFEDCCIGTACAFGMLSHPEFAKILPLFIKKYGDDFYVEMMPLSFDGQAKINIIAQQLCNNIPGLNVIATNDAHYVTQQDAVVHDTLLAIQTNSLLSSTSRFKFDTDEMYLKTRDEMFETFKLNHPSLSEDFINKALDTTVALAEKCNVVLPEFPICLPNPYDEDDLDVFASKLKIGWNEKQEKIKTLGKHTLREYMDRLLFEIDVIKKKNFVRYFLIVEDMISWARNNGIMVGPARGSSAGSLVCWLLGITQVDPLRWGLYFERFLDIEREDYPDIDVDFQDDKRHLVFEYIRSKYGYDKTAQITTFGFLKSKSAFRDVCRVNGKDMITVNYLSKQLDDESPIDDVPEVNAFLNKNPGIKDSVNGLMGTIRQQGCHAAGIVVSSKPLNEICVVERRSGSDVCNWDKRECENFGLVKIDVLGLSTLSVLSRAKYLIKKHRDVDIDFDSIDLRDEEVLSLFQEGKTAGVFQFESKNMKKLLTDIRPKDFEQVTDCTALYRPGALGSGQTEHYTQIAKGDDYESYLFPELKPILQKTYGNILYQEQIMQIFNIIGGFTWAEANKMRKIIGKKLGSDEFEKHREHFVSGAVSNGISDTHANKLFTDMVSFASYSFNASHAISYTVISWWCAFLKKYYPVEYFAAVLECSTKDDKVHEYIKDCGRLGIEIRLPDINISTDKYEVYYEDGTGYIVAPLGIVKNVGSKAVDHILEVRKMVGPFLSMKNFNDRITKRLCNIRVVESLTKAGAFESLGVGTSDQEQRAKELAEFVPIWSETPHIPELSEPIDKKKLSILYAEISSCAKEEGSDILMPYMGSAKASIFVINKPQSNETKNLSKEGTQYLQTLLKASNLTLKSVYYANTTKCNFGKAKAKKECMAKCSDYLRQEIAIVKPKLIICMNTDNIGMFTSAKPVMRDLHGKVIYNKEFDAYVMFAYSPQYLFFGEDKEEYITKFTDTLSSLFGDSSED